MLFGLSVTESVDTNLGARAGTMIRFCELCYQGLDANGDELYQVIVKFWESRAAYLAKEDSLRVPAEGKRLSITIPYGTEITTTLIHQYIKTPLAERYTLANENT